MPCSISNDCLVIGNTCLSLYVSLKAAWVLCICQWVHVNVSVCLSVLIVISRFLYQAVSSLKLRLCQVPQGCVCVSLCLCVSVCAWMYLTLVGLCLYWGQLTSHFLCTSIPCLAVCASVWVCVDITTGRVTKPLIKLSPTQWLPPPCYFALLCCMILLCLLSLEMNHKTEIVFSCTSPTPFCLLICLFIFVFVF